MRVKAYSINILRDVPNISYHNAFIVYTLFMIIWFWPFIFAGQVIAADFEITTNQDVKNKMVEDDILYISRNFVPDRVRHSDYDGHYIPDAHQSIKDGSYHWINTWVADYGFGVPLLPLQRGLSPIYFPTFVISLFTDNPYILTTLVHIWFNFLAGFVFIAYMKLLKIHPLAAVLGGITYATLPLFTYWATQNPFKLHAVWFIVLVYLLHRLVYDQRWRWLFLLSLAVQSTVLTVYLQTQVFIYTMLFVFVLYLLWNKYSTQSERIRYLLMIGVAGLCGVVMSAPVLLDFLHNVSQGLRVPLPASQVARVPIEEPHILLGYFIPEVFSVVPIPKSDAGVSNFYVLGFYITLVTTIFSLYGVFAIGRKMGALLTGLFVIMLVSLEPTMGYWYNKYLSVGISSWATIYAFFGPILLVIISTFGMSHFIESWNSRRNVTFEMTAAVLITGIILDVYVRSGMDNGLVPRWVTVVLLVVVLVVIWLSCIHRINIRVRSVMFVSVVLWATMSATFLAIPRMPVSDMNVIGEELTYVKQRLDTDEYMVSVSEQNFSQMGWRCCLVLGNRAATYDIRTVGVDTLLPQKRYQLLMENFGYSSGAYDKLYKYKHYMSITPEYDQLDYWMMNIGVVVSKVEQNHPLLTFKQKIDSWYIYESDAKGCCLQAPLSALNLAGASRTQIEESTIDPRGVSTTLQKDVSYTDFFEMPLASGDASIVVISQQYHKEWDAYALVEGQWVKIDTFAMNGIYQGAVTPVGATRVRFEFHPWTLLMWIPHLVWLFGLVAVALDMRNPDLFRQVFVLLRQRIRSLQSYT